MQNYPMRQCSQRLQESLVIQQRSQKWNTGWKLCIPTANHGIFVAEHERLLGWIHVSVIETMESESFAEIRGLVVSESYRGSGIGRQLVAAAEQWAHKKHCSRIRVRTNIVRIDAHAFYKKLGFVSKKTQHVFDKSLLNGG